MNKQDLIDSISEIDEELLERSERNKNAMSDGTEAEANGIPEPETREKPSRIRLWKRPAMIAAAVLLVLCLTGIIVFIMSNRQGENSILNPYLVSAAEYPEIAKKPDYRDFDEDGDGVIGTKEWETYFEASDEWSRQKKELKKVNGYDPALVKTGLLEFSAKLMPQLLKDHNHENVICSPLNIYIALGMLAETTDGNTRQQVLDLLGIENLDVLRSRMKGLWNNSFNAGNMKCLLASSVWLRDDIEYNKETLDNLAKYYYSSSFSGDMDSAEYSEAFRTWLNEQTDGILEEQISGLSFTPDTVIALATTVSFSAKWQSEFSKTATTADVFHAADGDIQCDFMHRTGSDRYCWGDRFGAVQKFFDFDGLLGSMMFILPDEGVSVYDLLEDEQILDYIDKGIQYEQSKNMIVNMSVPKFDVSSKGDICEALKRLGITDAFDAGKADFSPVSTETEGIFLSRVDHGVRVIADEEGVKAAAYTVELLNGAGMPPEEKIDFVLDRPFMFVIRLGDGLPLFVGIVENP